MLTHIVIDGYKSLKNIDLDMTGLTVLIGPNGSGKSNLLDVFALVAEAAAGSLSEGIARRGGFDAIAFKGDNERVFFGCDFEARGVFAEEQAEVHYKVQLRRMGAFSNVSFEQVSKGPTPPHTNPLYLVHRRDDDITFRNLLLNEREEVKTLESGSELAIFQVKDQNAYPTPYKLLRQFQDWTCYNPIDVSLESPIRLPQTVRAGMRLFPDGSNLASILHSIQNQSPAVWEDINEILRNVYEDFRYMTFPAEGGDGKILLRWWEHPFERQQGFSIGLLSDGTLRLLILLAILKSPEPPPLICIDEPELGLHPDWIKLVAELLEEAASRTQLVVATHSPILVSNVNPENVVVVEKEDGVTYLERLSKRELAVWLDEFHLGDLWLAGHLGGRP